MKWNANEDDAIIYHIVINHEEQYSIWPGYKEMPIGWRVAGKSGGKDECLAYIKEVWANMRLLRLRKHMEQDNARQAK